MNEAENRFTEVGLIGKTHGLDGTVRVQIFDNAVSLIKKEALLYLQNRRGDLIPARIEEVRVEEKQNKRMFFVKFDRISDRSEGKAYQDTPVYTDKSFEPDLSGRPEEVDVTGYDVIENSVNIGFVMDVLENPAHPILEVKITDENYPGIILIPAVSEYIVRLDHDNQQLLCQHLDRLRDL